VLIRLVGDSAPVRAALVEAAAGLAEVDFTLEIPFVRLRAVEGLPTMIAKFTTDIPQLSNWGEPLLLGPGSIHVAHTPYEKLSKKELRESVDLYIQVAKQLLPDRIFHSTGHHALPFNVDLQRADAEIRAVKETANSLTRYLRKAEADLLNDSNPTSIPDPRPS